MRTRQDIIDWLKDEKNTDLNDIDWRTYLLFELLLDIRDGVC